jgi:hypothetical protein
MTNMEDHEAIMDAIKMGIDVARRNPGPEDVDGYIAWCVLNQLRLAGWTVTPNSK